MLNRVVGGQSAKDDRPGPTLSPRVTDRRPQSLRLELEVLRLEWLLQEGAEQ